ncbi:hypothetical protein OBBRIDRAFT_790520 [Obba rivulosa]|uniref:DUF6534 domain-containing protein n=1 Tax=Obba rivulosa TaxID=1052685 RepID=A0A8E2DP75_9APHY|nr:hypothetical protein OBBRIDRAFT_790520 [Obba rivulosa]
MWWEYATSSSPFIDIYFHLDELYQGICNGYYFSHPEVMALEPYGQTPRLLSSCGYPSGCAFLKPASPETALRQRYAPGNIDHKIDGYRSPARLSRPCSRTPAMSIDCGFGVPTYQLTGPLVLGYQFNWALYGVLGMQVYIYNYAKVPEARQWTQLIVYGVFLLETLQIVMTTHDAFHELALSWGNCTGLVSLYWTWFDQPILAGITTGIIQCSYAYRIYIFSRSKALAGIISLTSVMQMSAATVEGILVLNLPDVADTEAATYKATAVRVAGTVFSDLLITGSMIYLLFRARRRTDFKETQTRLNKLIRLILETGLSLAVIAIVDLTLFLTFKHNYYHIAPALMVSKLYGISYLVFLNSRVAFVHAEPVSEERATIPWRVRDAGGHGTDPIQISINREVFTDLHAPSVTDLHIESIDKIDADKDPTEPNCVNVDVVGLQ